MTEIFILVSTRSLSAHLQYVSFGPDNDVSQVKQTNISLA